MDRATPPSKLITFAETADHHHRNPQAYESVSHARRSIGDYIELYNRKRPHSSLADRTPDEAYFATLPAIKSAA
ncbi:integrase core domain-containing protein [Burkholderia sp. BCC1630]|uniref:integrase core domain-containing protein n=1 Tax=Burkholderia sp. BCC1630 TaxID=2676304 RepID=UPI00158C3108|nr:integrase core domain-containing protein [Burkholderia sp. BCC1630]